MFSTVYRVTQKDFYALGNISVEVRRGAVYSDRMTGHSYLDMLENFAVPQIPPGFIFQQDDAPPHFHRDVTTCIKIFLSYSVHC
jgi:hypothetical protein